MFIYSFLVLSSSGFGIRKIGFIEWVGKCSHLFCILEEFVKGWCSFLMFHRIHLWSHLILGFSLWEVFDYLFNFFTCYSFIQITSLWVDFSSLCLLGICPFHLGFVICYITIFIAFHTILYNHSYLCKVGSNFWFQ